MQPAFNPNHLRRSAIKTNEVLDEMFAGWDSVISKKGHLDLNVHHAFSCLTLDILGKSFFSYEFKALAQNISSIQIENEKKASNSKPVPSLELVSESDKLYEDIDFLGGAVSRRLGCPPFLWRVLLNDHRQLQEAKGRLQSVIMKTLENKTNGQDQESNDLLDHMIVALNSSEKKQFTHQEMIDEIVLFLLVCLCGLRFQFIAPKFLISPKNMHIYSLAGHETTANTMSKYCEIRLFTPVGVGYESTLMYELAINQDIQSKLRQELDQVLGGRTAQWEDLAALKYLDMTVKENMRLHPVVPFTIRVLRTPQNIMGFDLPAGQNVGLSILGVHTDPRYWSDPETFQPERFNEKAEIVPGSYVPFGDGPQKCIGQKLAILEMK
ncbi:Cytochrome P450 3A4 [Quaeritorhiza haematococci]|nr:Cytochrome P450 3A4 [Quaeritorhiza haematococci]